MYEQDEANVFAEPSVMVAQLLPYLLQIVDRYAECPLLVQSLMAWAQENVVLVLDGLAASKELVPGIKLYFALWQGSQTQFTRGPLEAEAG